MAVKFRSRAVKKQRGKELFFCSAVLNSYIMLKHGRDRCWLPSCARELDSQNCQRHHWDFMGKLEDPRCYPEAIHLFCSFSCHERIHKIATLIISHLENYHYLYHEDLTQSIALLLNEPVENVKFVLKDEFVPAKIVEVNEGRYKLIQRKTFRILNIKRFLAIKDPQMAFQLGIQVNYN